MKKSHIFIANILFLLHVVLGIFILTGWMFPEIRFPYIVLLVGWLSCWIFLGYCPITDWEFNLRGRNKNGFEHGEFIQYYTYKFFKKHIPIKTIFTIGIIVFVVCITLSFFVSMLK